MRFLMIVAEDPNAEPYSAEDDDIEKWVAYVRSKNAEVLGSRLRPAAEGKTVRIRGGELRVTDGPFAESKEFIAGFDVLECESLAEAVEIASRHPMARFGQLEVREFWPFENEA